MASMSVSEFRAHLRDAIELVEAGESVEITRDGKVAAVLVHPSRMRGRARAAEAFAGAERIRQRLEAAKERPLWSGPGISVERGEEMIREIRAERDRRKR